MKKMFLTIAAAFLVLAASASAQTYSTFTPTYGGGYRFNSFGQGGSSFGTITPNYGGGYQFNSFGPNGNSWGTITPTYGGGYRISRFGY